MDSDEELERGFRCILFNTSCGIKEFVTFQREYLNNPIAKFMIKKQLIPTYRDWLKDRDQPLDNEIVKEDISKGIVKKYLDNDFPDIRSHPPKVTGEELCYMDKMNSALLKFIENPTTKFKSLAGDVWQPQKFANSMKAHYCYDKELGVLIFARYSGCLLIKGTVDYVPVVFGYINSTKYDLKCLMSECLLKSKHYCPFPGYVNQCAPYFELFRCESVLVVDNYSEVVEYKPVQLEEKYGFAYNDKQIARYLELETLPVDFKSALALSFQ